MTVQFATPTLEAVAIMRLAKLFGNGKAHACKRGGRHEERKVTHLSREPLPLFLKLQKIFFR